MKIVLWLCYSPMSCVTIFEFIVSVKLQNITTIYTTTISRINSPKTQFPELVLNEPIII